MLLEVLGGFLCGSTIITGLCRKDTVGSFHGKAAECSAYFSYHRRYGWLFVRELSPDRQAKKKPGPHQKTRLL